MSRSVLGLLLLGSWILLWGNVSVATLASGVLVVVALYLVFPSARPVRPRGVVHLGAFVRLVGYFSVQLVTSSVLLAREIVSRQSHLRSTIVDVEMRTSSQGMLTLITGIVALTPGTMAVAVRAEEPVVKVHALVLGDPAEVAESIWKIEGLCVRAFGTHDAVAELGEAAP